MAAPFIGSLLGWRAEPWEKHNKLVPNIADATHKASLDQSLALFDQLDVSHPDSGGQIGPENQTSGAALEAAVEQDLELPITSSLFSILFEGEDPHTSVGELMSRPARSERDPHPC